MNRLLTPLLVLLGLACAAAPANAYCIKNETSRTINVDLKTYSPLGGFQRTIRPNRKACCDWFDRRCNPTGTRDALVTLGIGGATVLTKKEKQSKVIRRRSVEDADDAYDRYGRRYDSYGVYLRSKVQPRRNLPSISGREKKAFILPELEPAPFSDPNAYYCSDGRLRHVRVTGAGTVTVWSDSLKPGKLRCDSRDYFLRPVQTDTPAALMGLPLLHMPQAVKPEKKRPENSVPGE